MLHNYNPCTYSLLGTIYSNDVIDLTNESNHGWGAIEDVDGGWPNHNDPRSLGWGSPRRW